jgi:hypothetical protein
MAEQAGHHRGRRPYGRRAHGRHLRVSTPRDRSSFRSTALPGRAFGPRDAASSPRDNPQQGGKKPRFFRRALLPAVGYTGRVGERGIRSANRGRTEHSRICPNPRRRGTRTRAASREPAWLGCRRWPAESDRTCRRVRRVRHLLPDLSLRAAGPRRCPKRPGQLAGASIRLAERQRLPNQPVKARAVRKRDRASGQRVPGSDRQVSTPTWSPVRGAGQPDLTNPPENRRFRDTDRRCSWALRAEATVPVGDGRRPCRIWVDNSRCPRPAARVGRRSLEVGGESGEKCGAQRATLGDGAHVDR